MTFALFTFCFLAVVTVLFYVAPKKTRAFVLLAASWFYVALLHTGSFVVLLIHTAVTYFAGQFISFLIKKGEKKKAGLLTCFCIGILTASLLCMKYTGGILDLLSLQNNPRTDVFYRIFLPIGFSYYFFQTISYLIDIYKEKAEYVKNPCTYALYISFFPKFVSGPIERPGHLLSQFEELPKIRFF